ncbi:MAG: hypothetical protein Q9227_002470, partial [Pyrenula ochraceoflavens]
KTCQVIAFLARLLEMGVEGTHLVVVPSSTLENWLKEFTKFCPALNVVPLYGSQSERETIMAELEHEQSRKNVNVVLTTYTIAVGKMDFPFLRKFGFNCTIFDEGHMLRNSKSQQYAKLVRIDSKFRLLLTGTPVQNNLQELTSLLGFILPQLFREKKDDLESVFTHKIKTSGSDSNHEALLSAQRIARARSMLTPFILRRQKHQVLKELPAKTSRVEYCDMNASQLEIYETERQRVVELLRRREAGENTGNQSSNILMKLRQAAIHPMLFRRHYTDKMLPKIAKQCIKDEQWANSNPDLILLELEHYSDLEICELCEPRPVLSKFLLKDDEWLESGKVAKLVELLAQFKKEGHRTLIFSQFVMVLNILERVLHSIDTPFLRIDGSTKVDERQDLIEHFYANIEIPVFMLTTKAGGAGINLAAANKIIIFDSSFNPQDDIQAENRAHRIGQTKEVEVVRLVSRGTVEEQIYAMGRTKVALDQKVAGAEEAEVERKVEELMLENMKGEEENGEEKEKEKEQEKGEGK